MFSNIRIIFFRIDIPNNLVEYISSKDEENETSTKKAQTYKEIITSNYDKIDFVHIYTFINGIKFGNSFINNNAYLVGCDGDT